MSSPFIDASLTLGVAMAMTVATGLAIAGSFRWLLADHNLASVARAIRASAQQLLDVFAGVEAQCGGVLFPEIRTLAELVRRELARSAAAGPAQLALLAADDPPPLPQAVSKPVSPTKPTGALPPLVPSLSVHSLAWPTTAAVAVDSQRNRKATPSPTREAAKRAGLGRSGKSASAKSKLGNKANKKPSLDVSSGSSLNLNDSSDANINDDAASVSGSVGDSLTCVTDDVADSPSPGPVAPTVSILRHARITLVPPSNLKEQHPELGQRPMLPHIATATLERHLRSLEDRLTRALEKVDSVRASEQGLRDALLQSAPLKALKGRDRDLTRSHTADIELASHPKIAAQIADTVELVRRKKSSLTKTIHRGLDIVDALLDLVCDPAATNVVVVQPPGHEKLGEVIEIGADLEVPEHVDVRTVEGSGDNMPKEEESLPGTPGEPASKVPSPAAFAEKIASLLARLPDVQKTIFEDLQAANEAALQRAASPQTVEGEVAAEPAPAGASSSQPEVEGEQPHLNGVASGSLGPIRAAETAAAELWKLAPNASEVWTKVSGFASDAAAKATDAAEWARQAWQTR